jgi:regulator of nucleoside diphosphate kinase
VIVQDELTVTKADRRRLREMVGSLRAAKRTVGDPYESYLRALEDRLDRSSVVAAADVGDDVVTMNSTVCVHEMDTNRHRTLTLAYENDADSFGEKVSVLTPLGDSILGARVGDIVGWHSGRGPRRVRIERIVFQPEAAGRFDL